MKSVVYPGSFDPCTNGHLDIITRCSKLFDKVIVAVLINKDKNAPMFSIEERVALIRTATADLPNVEVASFSGLLVDFMRQAGSSTIVKGLRAVSDFEYEFQMALTNKELDEDVETLLIPTSKEYMFLSSSLVREIAHYGGSLQGLVPDCLIPAILKKQTHSL